MPARFLYPETAEKLLNGICKMGVVRRLIINGPRLPPTVPEGPGRGLANPHPGRKTIHVGGEEFELHVQVGYIILELEKEKPIDGPTGKEYFRSWDHQNIKQFFIYRGKNLKDYKFKEDYMELVTGGSLYRTREENPCRFKDWDI
jgi:methyl-coenzyme M reductase subunit D